MAVKKLIIFPFNGNGIEALDCIQENTFEFIGFIDDSPEKLAAKNAWPVYKVIEHNRQPLCYHYPPFGKYRKKCVHWYQLPYYGGRCYYK
jgi:hypothetical protein